MSDPKVLKSPTATGLGETMPQFALSGKSMKIVQVLVA